MKVPMRAKNPVSEACPVMIKAYCPFKLELEKPSGGGGGGVELPPPLQAAANPATKMASRSAPRFIGALPGKPSHSVLLQPPVRLGSPAQIAPPLPAFPAAPIAQEKTSPDSSRPARQ